MSTPALLSTDAAKITTDGSGDLDVAGTASINTLTVSNAISQLDTHANSFNDGAWGDDGNGNIKANTLTNTPVTNAPYVLATNIATAPSGKFTGNL